ncbi:glycosyltransferase family 4 protein [Chitinophaga horti]|uniref:Glycosyltransferase family 4 protein n=1 Tax=Chitinophaga horti TaxID=2920382 RepID=A0ABY6IYG3_9BACT|nr:glycosyltransferase family 1 protein [Chitinophaga horti]UYQ92420.1 glycosyltransferase family 4 protein [Chitinophaga horti]
MTLYINLLNFSSRQIAGAGYFMKRLFEQINYEERLFPKFDEVHIFCNDQLDVRTVFSIPDDKRIILRPVKKMNSFLMRILYEQLVMPFLFVGKKGSYYAPTPVMPLLAVVIGRKVKYVCTVHDMIPFFIREKYGRLRGIYVRAISKWASRLSDMVITVSEHSKKDILFLTGIPSKKVKVVYNFLPATRFQAEQSCLPTLVTICTIEPGKNLENSMKGFKRLIEKYNLPHFRYIIIGKKGWNYDGIFAAAEKLSMNDKIVFTDYLPDPEKERFIKECSGIVYLSKYEGFGIPPLEGMYFSKPSIVANSSSLPEVVGQAGVICENVDSPDAIADGMYELITNRERYIAHIPDQLSKFSPLEQEIKFVDVLTVNNL